MGCDIHLFVERDTGEEFKAVRPASDWDEFYFLHGFDTDYEWEVGRDYRLFGRLAGVRDRSATPIADPRGLPDDASEPVRTALKEWNGDAHTVSWLADHEVVDDELLERPGWLRFAREVVERRPARIVFWFDN